MTNKIYKQFFQLAVAEIVSVVKLGHPVFFICFIIIKQKSIMKIVVKLAC